MGNKWTKEQSLAINKERGNILVAAAAGSGKTAVLVERIINKILKGTNIDEILVVTFTNASAMEMKERISLALNKALIQNPTNKHLKKQTILINKSSIMTIDAFCLNTIKEHAFELGIDSNINIADNSEINIMKQDVIEEVIERAYENDNIFIQKYSEVFSSKTTDLEDCINNLYGYIQSFPYPLEWLKVQVEKYNITKETKLSSIEFGIETMKYIKDELEIAKDNILQCIEISTNYDFEKYIDVLKLDLDNINLAIESDMEFDILRGRVMNIDFTNLPRMTDTAYVDQKEKLQDIRKKVKEVIKKLKIIVQNDESTSIEALIKLYPDMAALYEIMVDYDKAYKRIKERRGVLDFSDTEHLCLELLKTKNEDGEYQITEVAKQYIDKYQEIYIDEYQDSNYLQEYILTSISRENNGEPNIFMVGDIKQSIYAFRQARPELFLSKYNSYSDNIDEEKVKILLSKNFRSRKNILDSTNYIFRNLMKQELGGIEYNEIEELKLGANYDEYNGQDYSTEIDIIYNENDDETKLDEQVDSDILEDIKSAEFEAMYIADKIKELIGKKEKEPFKVVDKSGNFRDIKYKDIVILMRSHKKNMDIYSKVFREEKIPLFTEAGNFLHEEEIEFVISFLNIIDNPYQDIPLVSTMYSPIYNFTLDELTIIRQLDRKGYYYDALLKASAIADEKLADKVKTFLDSLNEYREISKFMSVKELLKTIYEKSELRYYLSSLANGKQKIANFNILLELASKYEQSSFKGLFNFINYVNRTKQSDNDLAGACIIGENEDTVRLMSIHKSKGLEFPVVILADMNKRFNLSDLNNKIIYNHELGLSMSVVDLDKRITYPVISQTCIKNKIKESVIAEELRILYVAMTRAKEKLIIVSSVKDLKEIEEQDIGLSEIAYRHTKNRSISNYTYLDLILMCLYKHRGTIGMLRNSSIEHTKADESIWKINYISNIQILNSMFKENTKEIETYRNWTEFVNEHINDVPAETKAEIKSNLEYKYEYADMTTIPNKLSISMIKQMQNQYQNSDEIIDDIVIWKKIEENSDEEKLEVRTPQFINNQDNILKPTEYGTLMHYIMQKLKFDCINGKEDIEIQIKDLFNTGYITDNEYKEMKKIKNIDKIYRVLESDEGKNIRRLFKDNKVYREIPFILNEEARKIYNEYNLSDPKRKLLLQGIIDLYYIDTDEEIVLIDFKTDKNIEPNYIKEKYKVQLEYYKKAIERDLGRRVKKKLVYLFESNEFIKI